FNGETWHDHEVGYAGTRLYPREDDYTGLICIDPAIPSTVYFSSNVIPWNGNPLISKADNKQHYEIWRCDTTNGGENWHITKVTSNSATDNIRPMMPEGSDEPILIWMEGEYITYQNFNTRVRCLVGDEIPTHKY
ncbi:MAG: hypothetical protein VX615_03255, partial [Planctomycetota bacterium]|nr:hypothetical protein [Planctomycetota bacterium]